MIKFVNHDYDSHFGEHFSGDVNCAQLAWMPDSLAHQSIISNTVVGSQGAIDDVDDPIPVIASDRSSSASLLHLSPSVRGLQQE